MILSLCFLIIVFLSVVLFYFGAGRNKVVLYLIPIWAIAVGYASYIGFFKEATASQPRMLLVIVPAIAFVIWFYKKMETHHLRPRLLLWVHVLRIPVELVLHQLYRQQQIPKSMTFDGYNFDIISGISALALLTFTGLFHKTLNSLWWKVWNIGGIILLAVIFTLATLSAPSPMQQLALDQPNRAILEFPYTLLPGVVVPIVLLCHLVWLKTIAEKQY